MDCILSCNIEKKKKKKTEKKKNVASILSGLFYLPDQAPLAIQSQSKETSNQDFSIRHVSKAYSRNKIVQTCTLKCDILYGAHFLV